MIAFLGLAGCLILALLAGLHVSWAVSARGVHADAIPTRPDGTPVLNPGPIASLGVAVLLLAAAFLVMERAGWGPGLLARPWRLVGTTAVALALLLRGIGDFRYVGLFKQHRDSAFARMDSRVYTPLVLALSALAGAVAAWGE